jgi:hypothetical protein
VIFFKLLDELEITLPDGCFQTLGLDWNDVEYHNHGSCLIDKAKFSSLTFIICPNIVCIWNVYRRLDGEIILRKYLKYGQWSQIIGNPLGFTSSRLVWYFRYIGYIRYDHVCLRRRQVH